MLGDSDYEPGDGGGVPLAFSILCNHHHPTSDSDQVRAAQAAIVNALADLPLSMP